MPLYSRHQRIPINSNQFRLKKKDKHQIHTLHALSLQESCVVRLHGVQLWIRFRLHVNRVVYERLCHLVCHLYQWFLPWYRHRVDGLRDKAHRPRDAKANINFIWFFLICNSWVIRVSEGASWFISNVIPLKSTLTIILMIYLQPI